MIRWQKWAARQNPQKTDHCSFVPNNRKSDLLMLYDEDVAVIVFDFVHKLQTLTENFKKCNVDIVGRLILRFS